MPFPALLACTAPPADLVPDDPVALVDRFVGTGGTGAQVAGVSPGAAVPFGHVLVGPDTRHSSYGAPRFYHFGGYHWDDDLVEGFSHTHSHGMGVNDHGAIHVMPRASFDPAHTDGVARAAPFDHARETAVPGRYSVDLMDDGVSVDIVATVRGAVHRYAFPGDVEPVVWFDLGHVLGDVAIAEADIDLFPSEVTGHQLLLGEYSGRYGGQHIWFSATFDPEPVETGAWDTPDAPVTGATRGAGSASGGWVRFAPGTALVEMRLALSAVDLDGARANRVAELAAPFDALTNAATEAWGDYLDGVRIEGGDATERAIATTAHANTALMPRQYADVDGRVRGIDGNIHTVDFDYVTDLSLWDTFRTLHPFLLLAHPDRQRDSVRSLAHMAEVGGAWPRWPLSHGYTGGMVGTPADQVLAQSALAGLDGWDAEAAFDSLLPHAFEAVSPDGRDGIDGYAARGWVAAEEAGASASLTLEYAWSDHALSLWAASLGRTDDAARLDAQAVGWRELVDPATGFVSARFLDGTFDPIDEPFAWDSAYVEGNALHYRWGAPWDVQGHLDVQYGGDVDAFDAALLAYWDEVAFEPDDALPDDWYWHGNEPDLHYAALGALIGRARTTEQAVRWIASHRYGLGPTGLDGNDDGGTLSAWYLLWSMGLYPVAGTPTWVLGCPFFDRIEVPAWGLVIEAPGAGPDRPHCTDVRRDGAPWPGRLVAWDDLVDHTWTFTPEPP
jgi:predicted alpha-1,2-mannosidase